MYQIDSPIYFYFFSVIPLIILGYLFLIRWKINAQKKFSSDKILDLLSPKKSSFKPLFKLIIFLFAIAFLIIGLVNPKIGTELETVKREGIDIVFAIDVSKSMLAEDIAPNRIEKAKRLVFAILEELVSDRVGIIAYAAQAIPQLPITTDYASAKMFLKSLNTDMLSSQGTAIDAAINLGKSFFDDQDQTNRVLIIISDGEDHEELSMQSAKKADELGIKIFTLGVGTEQGAPIPIKENGVVQTYKKDKKGDVIITKRNPVILKEISSLTNARYFDGNNTQKVIDFIRDELKEIDKKEFEAKKFISFKDQFQFFLILGLAFIIIDIFVFETKTFWIQKLNLFNEKDKE